MKTLEEYVQSCNYDHCADNDNSCVWCWESYVKEEEKKLETEHES
jgi:hypothetical protein